MIDRREFMQYSGAAAMAAIANAIYHATGQRLRKLPFTPDRFA